MSEPTWLVGAEWAWSQSLTDEEANRAGGTDAEVGILSDDEGEGVSVIPIGDLLCDAHGDAVAHRVFAAMTATRGIPTEALEAGIIAEMTDAIFQAATVYTAAQMAGRFDSPALRAALDRLDAIAARLTPEAGGHGAGEAGR